METSTPVLLRLQPDLLKEIEDWRWAHRTPSRAEAIRRLIERGLSSPAPNEPRRVIDAE
jgi:metal-responsive CopG/Arc/MetJ family transcriptional regulator